MIISHKYKIVFIHIPKNAGTYITAQLYKIDANVQNYIIDGCGHMPYEDIKKLKIYDEIKNYTFFAVVRNPINMYISFYHCARKNKIHYLNSYVNNNDILHTLKFCLDEKMHFKPNIYYISESDEINNNIVLLNFENISVNFKNFMMKIILENNSYMNEQEINDVVQLINDEKINDTLYYITDEKYIEIKKCLENDEYFSKDLIFFNNFKQNL